MHIHKYFIRSLQFFEMRRTLLEYLHIKILNIILLINICNHILPLSLDPCKQCKGLLCQFLRLPLNLFLSTHDN